MPVDLPEVTSRLEGPLVKQFSVFLANKVGAMLDVVKLLNANHTHVVAMSVSESTDSAIARIIVALAKSLGIGVMAEGVETDDQHRFLVANGCQSYQGFLFSRPVSMEEFMGFASCATLDGIA